MQFVADIARLEERASSLPELSALGAVLMGTLRPGAHSATEELGSLEHGYDAYEPPMAESTADEYHQGWQRAVARVL
jgi:glycerol kinase